VTALPLPPGTSAGPRGLLLACACGARPSAGWDLLGSKVRCPACKAPLAVPDRRGAGEPVADPAEIAGASCPICLTGLGGPDAVASVRCPACRLAYHAECWGENGGCGAFGCPLAPEAPKEEQEGPVQTAWGDAKKCPRCGKEIQAIAIKCRHCKADLGTRDAISTKEWREMQRLKADSGKGRTVAVAAFLCSATCVAMPVGVGIALYHLLPRARRESLEGPERFLLAGALAVAGLYLVLLLAIRVAGW
jgi:hypothetical protein